LPRRDLGLGQGKRDFSLTRMGSVGSSNNPVSNWTDSLPRRDFYNLPSNNTNSLPRRDRAGKQIETREVFEKKLPKGPILQKNLQTHLRMKHGLARPV
jgi:hypothetical protein